MQQITRFVVLCALILGSTREASTRTLPRGISISSSMSTNAKIYNMATRLHSSQISKTGLFSASNGNISRQISPATLLNPSHGIQSSFPSFYGSSLQTEPSSSPSDLSMTSFSPYSSNTFIKSITPYLGAYATKLTDTSYIYSQPSGSDELSSSNLFALQSATSGTRSSSPSSIQQFMNTPVFTPTIQSAVKPTATHTATVATPWSTSNSTILFNQGQTTATLLPAISSSKCSQNGGCCTKGLSQFPSYLQFQENQSPGTILVPIFGVENVDFRIEVHSPPELRGYLEEYFNITQSASSYLFQIIEYIDIEDLYLKANKNNRVTNFQLQILCVDSSPGNIPVPPRIVNITILDVDDTMPVFQGISGHESCVVPLYTADTSETFVGQLQVSPTPLRAVDGDLTQKYDIAYRVMHAEPNNYDLYFELNVTDGTVSKTKTMNTSNPKQYVLFVEAMEESPEQQKRVAILSIKILPSVVISEQVHKANPTAKLLLEVLSVVVISGFVSGFVFLLCHRKRLENRKVETTHESSDYDFSAVTEISCSSRISNVVEVPAIASPSAIVVTPARSAPSPYAAVRNKNFIRRERSPLDTALRPAWNAPKPKIISIKYNPFTKKGK